MQSKVTYIIAGLSVMATVRRTAGEGGSTREFKYSQEISQMVRSVTVPYFNKNTQIPLRCSFLVKFKIQTWTLSIWSKISSAVSLLNW